ncbi:hypothetical protein [Bradyrhizobium sp. RD5-C2]|uniref:hypothetical protein n=1 Tax=Bradyrhizobium sp. RD5-C2 TaxID=244562 RepID=UPI001CC4A259|nr:hypothetical protein [Bradyrhizobium sp. RD5-C2]
MSNRNEAAAVGVFCWGAVIMLAGDHFVSPVLVGGSARLPFLFAFVEIFGWQPSASSACSWGRS